MVLRVQRGRAGPQRDDRKLLTRVRPLRISSGGILSLLWNGGDDLAPDRCGQRRECHLQSYETEQLKSGKAVPITEAGAKSGAERSTPSQPTHDSTSLVACGKPDASMDVRIVDAQHTSSATSNGWRDLGSWAKCGERLLGET